MPSRGGAVRAAATQLCAAVADLALRLPCAPPTGPRQIMFRVPWINDDGEVQARFCWKHLIFWLQRWFTAR